MYLLESLAALVTICGGIYSTIIFVYSKFRISQMIDEKICSQYDKKLADIISKLSFSEIKILDYLNSGNNKNKINFADEKFIQLKILGLVNESIDYEASNNNIKALLQGKLINCDPLIAYITLTSNGKKIIRIIHEVQSMSDYSCLLEIKDLPITYEIVINRFGKMK